MDAARVSVLVY